MSGDTITFEISGELKFTGFVTSEDCVAFTSNGQVLHIPSGTPIPDFRTIEVKTVGEE